MKLYSDLADHWRLLSPPEDYAAEVPQYAARLAAAGVGDRASLLHLGSGGGSLDYHLKSRYRITGVDQSPQMVAVAARTNPEVDYRVGDILTVRLGRNFEAVLLHDASAYLTTRAHLRAAFDTAAAHLRPGGAFLVYPEELRQRFRQGRVHTTARSDAAVCMTTVEIDNDPDPADTWFERTFVFVIAEPGRPPRVVTEVHRLALYELADVLDELRAAGFDSAVGRLELPGTPPDEEHPLITGILQART